ncbi:transmembrane protein 6/97 [Lasiosphaeria hispida]|uniref:Transmembrane protein 6/97 n=1 Tax=Lasiosphaeria hispida TaxID=260671 RepID=A0AAJ0HH28_9PEZI|nr:transmembrane protein 6/97 [Lasiosphaeria hispida]
MAAQTATQTLLVEFYPKSLYELPGAPLHFAQLARLDYLAKYNDPIVQWSAETASGHDSWMGLFIVLEYSLALPVMLFTFYRFAIKRRGTSGAHELLLAAYGFETALATLVCIHDIFYWDETLYTLETKNTLIYSYYVPWLVVPSLITIDMVSRILGRIRVADAALVGKKTQ